MDDSEEMDLEIDGEVSNEFGNFNSRIRNESGKYPPHLETTDDGSLFKIPNCVSARTVDKTRTDGKTKVDTLISGGASITESDLISSGDSSEDENGGSKVRLNVAKSVTISCDESGEENENEKSHKAKQSEDDGTASSGESSSEESVSVLESSFSDLEVKDDEENHTEKQRVSAIETDISNSAETKESFDELIYAKDEDGDNLLHMSVIMATTHISLHLIALTYTRTYLDTVNKLFQTTLHLAVLTTQVVLVQALVSAGALVNMRDNQLRTPFHIACKMGHLEMFNSLLSSPQLQSVKLPPNLLTINAVIAPSTIQHPLDITNNDGETCLHISTKNNNIDMTSLLLDNGADVNLADGKSKRTALHFASEVGNIDMVKLLMQHPGVKVNCQTRDGQTPIIIAFIRGHTEVVNLLKDRTPLNIKKVMKYYDYKRS